ncbi:hypothetical protein DL769_001265 [Monosporascus sp. CRB-8-3]|nr:hypothetical protein DL769_001265 [Monosporascus sp. CRB-8-3]
MRLVSGLPLILAAFSVAADPQKLINTHPDAGTTAEAQAAPFKPPTILSTSFSGNGCPQSGSRPLPSGGWGHFGLTLPDFTVSYRGSGGKTSTANCQAHVSLANGVPGWQVGLKDLWSRGYAELDPGVKLTQYVTAFYTENAANTVSAVQSVTSSPNKTLAREVALHATIPDARVVWSKCTGRDGVVGLLNVNFRMALTSTDREAYGYYGGAKNLTVSERWGWTWRRC